MDCRRLASGGLAVVRLVLVVVLALTLAQRPNFALWWMWYFAVTAVMIQMVRSVLLLQRELRRQ